VEPWVAVKLLALLIKFSVILNVSRKCHECTLKYDRVAFFYILNVEVVMEVKFQTFWGEGKVLFRISDGLF
jgi:hypothetical protein